MTLDGLSSGDYEDSEHSTRAGSKPMLSKVSLSPAIFQRRVAFRQFVGLRLCGCKEDMGVSGQPFRDSYLNSAC